MSDDKRGVKLERASANIKKQFPEAAENRRAQIERARAQGQGSEMVKNHKPVQQLAPKGPVREAVDRQAYNEKLNQEAQKKARENFQKRLDLKHGRDKDRNDRGR